MNTKQVLWAAGIVVVLGLAAWGLGSIKVPQPGAGKQAITHVLAGAATTTAAGAGFAYTEDHPYYTVSIVYPDTGNQAEQTAIETALKAELDEYAQNVADLDPSMMPSLAQGYKLALDATYQKYAGAGNTTSYLFTLYEDTGGAHPNSYFKTFVFNAQGSPVALADVLSKNPNWLEELSLLVSQDVTKQVAGRLGSSAPQGAEGPDVTGAIFAEGLAPKAENFENFVIDGSTLVIEIPPYQVAAYAMGSFEVRIPLSEIDK